MSYPRGLTELNGNFKTQARLVAANVKENSLVFIDGVAHTVDSTDKGEGVLLDNGLYANPALDKVVPFTVSGTVTPGGVINQIRDSGTFTAPLAADYEADTILVIDLPELYKSQTPTLNRSGGDLFENEDGTDTSITWVGAAKITLTSDGVSKWSL